MNLNEIIETVMKSRPEDWHHTGIPAPHRHDSMAVLIADPTIAIVWGRTIQDPYEMPWTKCFPDRRAVSFCADIYFHQTPVFRTGLVGVDGFRCYLPIPYDLEGTVPTNYARFAWLITAVDMPINDYPDYFRRAGFVRQDAPWPTLT